MEDRDEERGPLVLGSGGRVGRLLRGIAARGLWPGPEPLWHTRDGRDGTLGWDLLAGPPAGLALRARGVVVLAGATAGDEAALAANAQAARAALSLARERGLGPVLLLSTAAVYGRAPGPSPEDGPARPASPYGHSKLAMERAVDGPEGSICCLRLGNVAGADALFGAMANGPVTLDRFEDGRGPRRACIGPLTLARALAALLGQRGLPPVLNLAQPGLVAMDDILGAAGQPFSWQPAPPTALPALALDLSRLLRLAPLPPATAASLVEEARLGGWRPSGEGP